MTSIKNWLDENVNVSFDYDQYLSGMKVLENAFEKFSSVQFNMEELDNSQFDVKEEVDDEFYEIISKLNNFSRKFSP